MGEDRRSRLAVVGAAGAVALSLVASPARSGDDFVPGSGDVKASFLALSPETAGLSVGVVVGETLADYQNDVARAQSRAVNTGALGASLAAKSCAGGDPSLKKEDLPTTVRVDSREPGAAEGKTDYWPILPRDLPYQFDDLKPDESGNGGLPNLDPPADSPARSNVSRLHARAANHPSSLSTSDTGVTYVAGVADLVGGHTQSAARIENGKRIGEAVVTIPEIRLGGGAVVLSDLEWRAVQTTGPAAPADTTYDSSFRMGSATVGGATYGWPDQAGAEFQTQAQALLSLVNTALAPTGLVVDFPKTGQDGGHATVTPLSVKIDRPPLGRELFAMLPKAVYDARREILDRAIQQDCRFASVVIVGDIILATPAGAGTTRVSFGGADGFTEGTQFANPFAFRPRTGGTAPAAPGGVIDTEVEGAAITGAAFSAPTTPVEPTPSAGGYGTTAGGLAAGEVTVPGSKSGTAAVVGIIGLLAVLSVALLDVLKPRRVGIEGGGIEGGG